VESIQRGTDAFFEHLTRFSDEWRDGRTIHTVTPWLLLASAMAYEWVRLRRLRRIPLVSCNEHSDIEPMAFLVEDEG
jgi:hypothetical protein